MIKSYLYYFLPFAVAAVASADEGGRSRSDEDGSSNAPSCSRPAFCENLQQGILLTATSNAPAGASGKAQIIAVNNNGTNLAVLFVKTTGLTNGAYTVDLTDVSGSNTYSLGALNVPSAAKGFDHKVPGRLDRGRGFGGRRGSSMSTNWDNWTNWVGQCARTNDAVTNFVCGRDSTNWFGTNAFRWYTNCLTVGSGSFILPSGLEPTNVAGISIADTNGVVDLTGDFTGVTNTTSVYIQTVSIVPGTATNAQGQATLTITTKNGKSCGAFKLSATGLDAKEKLVLTANGTNTVKVCTSKTGSLTVKSLPRVHLVDLSTVVATDVSSNVVFSVSF